MVKVHLPSALRGLAQGAESVEVDASDVRQLIAELERRFPGLGHEIGTGMAIAIDGEIIQEPLLERLGPRSEVHFLPPIGGG